MNGNQGLEALAALCGGEAAVATGDSTTANTSNSQSAEQQQPSQQQHQAPAAQSAQVADLTRQQWQQAMAAAAAIGGGQLQAAPAAGAPAGLTAQSLALLSAAGLQQGMQQHLQQHQLQQQPQPAAQQQPQQPPALDSNAALAAMQQLAYFRYIQDQTNAAVAKIGQNAAAANMNPLLHSNPQAMALVLAGQAQ